MRFGFWCIGEHSGLHDSGASGDVSDELKQQGTDWRSENEAENFVLGFRYVVIRI